MSDAIVIAGAGQLGSRYLQGLAAVTRALDVCVVDVWPEALERAEARWQEVASNESLARVTFTTNMNALPALIELAIVATNADVRPAVVRELGRSTSVRNWVIEKVLAQSESTVDDIEGSVSRANAWVNTPRRMMQWHQQLKSQLPVGQPMTVDVTGGSWGLACNAVHFLDLVEWWSQESLVAVETDELKPQWITAKRAGFSEVTGTLVGKFSGGSQARLTATESTESRRMRLRTGGLEWSIDESGGTATRSDGLQLPGALMPQSRLTADLVESILATGDCRLPTLRESGRLHRVFLRAMIAHRRDHVDPESVAVPIT